MSGDSPPDPEVDAIQFADYVASLAAELSKLSREHGLTTLAYVLEITRLEARSIAKGSEFRPGRPR